LEKYDYRSARQYVTGTLTGPDFARGLANVSELDARQRYPLAIRSPEQVAATGAARQTVNLTADVMKRLSATDTSPTAADYVLMQQTIERAEHVTQDGNAWRYALQSGDRWSVATVEDDVLTDWVMQDTPEAS
ncbi:TPA: phage head morphogenesis protein, partial [Escherichia coli]|nr:phage head morphogenesis protein [Escherichia coli]